MIKMNEVLPNMLLINIKAVITIVNLLILFYLLFIYRKNYREIKSKFSLGLIIFILLLIVQTFTSNPFVYHLWGFRHIEAFGLSRIMPDLFELVALMILLYISRNWFSEIWIWFGKYSAIIMVKKSHLVLFPIWSLTNTLKNKGW